MKKISRYLIIIFILIPITVKANIVCNDGTISPSCGDCHKGCCSRHGGCTDSSNSIENNSKTQDSDIPTQEIQQSKNPEETSEPELQKSVELTQSIQQEENDNEINGAANKSNSEGNGEKSEFTDGLIGLSVLGGIGALIYVIKKKKG